MTPNPDDATMFDDAWFERQVYTEEDGGCLQQQADILKEYYHHQKTTLQAATELARSVEELHASPASRAQLYVLLSDALIEWPEDTVGDLVALLATIQERDTLIEGKSVWHGLPSFANQWHDGNHADPPLWRDDQVGLEGDARAALIEKQRRVAKAECCLVNAGVGQIQLSWGFDTVCDALESEDATLDVEVPMANEWLQLCESQFRAAASARTQHRALRRQNGGMGEPEMSFDRLRGWWERLRELQHADTLE